MRMFRGRLKNQLTLFNAFSKLLIFGVLLLLIPYSINKISIKNTDNNLYKKLDQLYDIIDSTGIESFIDADSEIRSYGSYNILKAEYISIEQVHTDSLYESIESTRRIIEDEIVDYRVISAVFGYDENEYYLIEIGRSINDIVDFKRTLQRFILIFLLIVIVITVVVDISFIQSLLRPFDHIINKLKRSTSPHNFDYSPVKTMSSDFMYLENSINNLMRKIEIRFNDEREFISNVSHELLTPISIIQNKIDNSLNSEDIPVNIVNKLVESKKTLNRLTVMIRTLLLMSRIENNEFIKSDSIDLKQIVDDVIEEIYIMIQAKELNLISDINSDLPVIKGNRDLIFNLIFNLVTNAAKHTPESGSVDINLSVNTDVLVFKIRNSGSGINKDVIPEMFSRFKRFDNSSEGYGIGLALAKKIADYHNVLISVDSDSNSYTEFTLQFKI